MLPILAFLVLLHTVQSQLDDNKGILNDGQTETILIKPGEIRKLNIVLENDQYPFWLIVTPCGEAVAFKIDHTSLQGNIGFKESGILLRTSCANLIAMNFQKRCIHMIISMKFAYPKVFKYHPVISKLKCRLIENSDVCFSQKNDVIEKRGYLIENIGESRMEYFNDKLMKGIIEIYLWADHETTVELFATVKLYRLDRYFPKLPHNVKDRQIQLVNVTARSALFRWEHSPSIYWFKSLVDVEYCLTISKTREYKSFCQFLAKLPPPEATVAPTQFEPKRYSLVCTKHSTFYQFHDLKSDCTYYVSMFAINTITRGSVAYKSLSFKTKAKNEKKKRITKLQDAKLESGYLNSVKGDFKIFDFHVSHFYKEILFVMQPCSGYIRVNIYKDRKFLRKSVVFNEMRRFHITNVQPGQLRFKVINDDPTIKSFRLWISARPSKSPYPRLPDDTSIVDRSRGCTQVTLAWLPSNGHVRYCLYKRRETDQYFKKLIMEEPSGCRATPNNAVKVVCLTFDRKTQDDVVLTSSVSDLLPMTTYRFDLFVTPLYKNNRQSLTYRTIWVKTKRCDKEL